MPTTDTVLHQLLERRLLDIGEDDTRFDRLRQASEALASQLADEPALAIPFALAAVDPSTPAEVPAFESVHQAVADEWPTYRNRWPDAPTEVWRAVLLDALAIRGESVPEIAAAVALTFASMLPRLEPGRDHAVLLSVYRSMRHVAELRAAKDWSDTVPAARLRVAKPKLTTEDAGPIRLDEDRLRKLFAAAAGPAAQDGSTLPNPNPYWPNNPQYWSYEFAPRATDAVSKVVNAALVAIMKQVGSSSSSVSTQIGQWAATTGEAVRHAVAEVTHGAEGVQRRSSLLWWRAALFSPAAGKSYRDTPLVLSALQMAIDLHAQVPSHAPESVEHFLREAVRDLVRDTRAAGDARGAVSSSNTWVALTDAVRSAAEVESFPSDARHSGPGRATLLELLEAARLGGVALATDALVARLGPAGTELVAVDELAAWVFRDLQAHRLLRGLTNEHTRGGTQEGDA